jgi:trimethylamine--corrinoid protein Co-methyltransferase
MAVIHLPRPQILTPANLEQIHEAALRILESIGLLVRAPQALEAAARLSLTVRDQRVLFDRSAVNAFVEEFRPVGARHAVPAETEEEEPSLEILLAPCQYAVMTHDLETDEIVPFTTERLIAAAKLLDTLTPYGVIAKTPGTPMDAPADLQPILKYRIQALYCRHGRRPVELGTPRATPYLLDMAEALGHPITSADVYVVSPLTLGGESFDCALEQKHRLQSLWVSNMSSMAATAPIRLGDALALGVAEVVGAAILSREVVGLPVDWSVRVTPFDPRFMCLTLGGPEEYPLQWASDEVNAWYHGRAPGAPWGGLHSQAKLPDQQAAMERTTMMLTLALFGTRVFGGIGRLSLDEVFSPEQAVLDLELRDHVQRLIAGADGACDPEACLAEVAAGLPSGFLGLDSTADLYAQTYWRPRLFWRGMVNEWRTSGSDLHARAKEMVRRQLKLHDYELEPDVRREVERIYARAERELA